MSTGYVVTWDDSPSSALSGLYVQKVRRRMVGAVRDQLITVPGRDGGWVYPERRGFRQITAECTLTSPPSTRHAAVVSVADWLDKTGERQLKFNDQPDRYWLATLTDDPDPDEWRSRATFALTWTAQPYAYAVSTTSVTVTALSPGTLSGNFTAADTIDAYPEVTITPLNGTMTAIDFTLNDSLLSWAGSLASGVPINLSSVSDTVTTGVSTDAELTGAYTPGLVNMADVSGEFGMILEGFNTWAIDWTGTATTARIRFRWRRRYR